MGWKESDSTKLFVTKKCQCPHCVGTDGQDIQFIGYSSTMVVSLYGAVLKGEGNEWP